MLLLTREAIPNSMAFLLSLFPVFPLEMQIPRIVVAAGLFLEPQQPGEEPALKSGLFI
jgi:hypothetical protein